MNESETIAAVIAVTLGIPAVALSCLALAQNPTVCDVAGNQEVRKAWRAVAKPLEHAVRVTAKEAFDAIKRQGGTPGISAA